MSLKNYALTAVLLCISAVLRAQHPAANPSSPALLAQAQKMKAHVRNGFTQNKGQVRDQHGQPVPDIRYLLNMDGLNVQLRPGGFSYDAYVVKGSKEQRERQFHRVDIDLEGANLDARMIASEMIAGSAVQIISKDNELSGIRDYGKVTYKEIYPGIDLEFVARAGKEKPVEYNFIVHPGADASRIRMKYNNGSDIALKNGMIEMQLAFGTLKEKIPASYTEQDGKALAVVYKTENEAQNIYAFNIPAYDRKKTLVIDPTPDLAWATYFGTTGGDRINDVAVDNIGNVYASGTTGMSGLGTTGAYQNSYTVSGTNNSIFVAKFTAAGKRAWSTYYAGNSTSSTYALGLQASPSGDAVYVSGFVLGASLGVGTLLTTPTGHSTTPGGGQDGILLKLNASGNRVWDTYYGGTGTDKFCALAIGGDGAVYATGTTNSTGLSAGASIHKAAGDATGVDVILVKFNAAGVRQWATYFGGDGTLDDVRSISLDANDNIYISGTTTSTSGIAGGATEGQVASGSNKGFIARFNPSNGARTWGRYYGNSGNYEYVNGVAVDKKNGWLYACGLTTSTTDIATPGAFQEARTAARAGFLVKFNLSGQRLWGTYIGAASSITYIEDVRLDAVGNVYVYGLLSASSASLVTSACSYQPRFAGGFDLLINKFTPGGQRVWGTLFGSAGSETINTTNLFPAYNSVFAVDGPGNVYIGFQTTETTSTMSTAGSFQPVNQGGTAEGVLAKFTEGMLPVDFKVAASTITPLSQNACALGVPQNIVGNSVNGSNPPDFSTGIFYQWQTSASATGPWTDLAGETFKDLTPPTGSSNAYFRRLVKANNGYCDLKTVDSSAVSLVNITGNIAPTANANGPQWFLCAGNSITLNGSGTAVSPATITGYQWFTGSATTASVTTANFTPTNITEATTYTLRVMDNNGCVSLDQVNVVPVTANAGAAVSFCQGSGGVQIGTTPVSSNGVSYNWTLVSGTPVATALSCVNCAQPVASPLVASTYRLTVTVTRKDNSTCVTTSDVTVTPVAAPNNDVAFGGTDKTICKNTTVTLGTANDATATYAWTPGTYLSSTTIFNPLFNAGTTAVACPMTYTVTATKGGCSFQDQVSVSVIDPDIDHGGQTFCGPGWVSGSNANCSNATYAWQLITGNGTVVSTRNGGADAYLRSNTGNAVFRRTTTVNGITCNSTNVTVQACAVGSGCSLVDIKVQSAQGCPKVFAGTPLQLSTTGIASEDYNFSWTPANLVDNPTSPVVNVLSTAQATITVTVTNKYDPTITCTDNLLINPASWSLPVANVSDKNTCAATPVNIGTTSVAGYTYNWSPATGLNNAATSNPAATLSSTSAYALEVTETATGCKVQKNVTVNVSSIDFDAGPTRAVCNNGVATLGTTPGGSYTYSWTPVGAAWQNGTNATSANPQVLFAGAAQTFTVTVTDPLTGCTLTDNVTLSGTVSTGSYAGAPQGPLCAGTIAQLGRDAVPGASYLWSPATGLSATNVSNPIATPASTTTYTVAVSYQGCSTPITDQVTVTVQATAAFDFVDKTICPSTPTNIGLNGVGNPTTIADAVSYSWSPSTGLSCANCASPNANPQTATTYTCVVTFANGCTRSDNVTITPTFAASAKPDAVICAGASVVLGQPSVANVTYAWTPGTGLSATNIAQPTANPTATTDYTLTATGTGVNAGCVITDAVRVTVNTPVPFTINGNAALCAGGSTTLGFTPANTNMLYQWSPETGVASPKSSNTLVTPSGSQVYRLVQTDLSTGCSNFQQIKVTVLPNTIAANGDSVKLCSNSGIALPLTVTSAGTYSYSWSPASFLSNAYVKNPITYATSNMLYTATITDNASNCQLVVPSVLAINICAVSLYGNIFHDANGQNDNTVNSSAVLSNLPSGMYVSLVDASNKIIATVPVNADGTYKFDNVAKGTYSVVLGNSANGTVTPIVPAGWQSTGANLGTQAGSAGNTGILPNIVVGAADVYHANIAIQEPPRADTKVHVIAQPFGGSTRSLNGNGTISAPGPLSGSDLEDGVKGSGATFTVTSLAEMNGNELYYNGALVLPGVPIPNYNPSLLSVKFTGQGSTGLAFSYTVTDAAGATSTPATYSISWSSALPLQLLRFTALKSDKTALLEWQTANEQQTASFVVERSADAKAWTAIGQQVAGRHQYSLRDEHPKEGTNYYRLRIMNQDGSYTLSEVKSLVFGSITNSVILAPNPSTGDVTLSFRSPLSATASLRVVNTTGAAVRSMSIAAGVSQYQLTLQGLAQGLYIVYIQGSDINTQVKLMLK